MTFPNHTSCSSEFMQNFPDHYMNQCQILLGYFFQSFYPIDFKPWHSEPFEPIENDCYVFVFDRSG